MTEKHPLEPWMPSNARLLMCGTFPPPRARWSMDFYYPNYINDMWRIFGIIFHGDKDWFVDVEHRTFHLEAIKEMLLEAGIALSDTGREVVRTKGNASDKYLDIVRPIDVTEMLERLPECVAVATTGEKAAQVIADSTSTLLPRTGDKVMVTLPSGRVFAHWRMPSTSRAYPLPIDKKAEYYRCMLMDCGIIRRT